MDAEIPSPAAGTLEVKHKEGETVPVNQVVRVVISDNEASGTVHRAGYNGVAELSLAAPGAKNLFVPPFAGLNFEHIFSGDSSSFAWDIFEPRRAPMQLIHRSPNRIELLQERTGHWPLRSRLAL